MFAVIKTGGKQYRVAANDRPEDRKARRRMSAISSKSARCSRMAKATMSRFGAPFVDGALVTAEVVEQGSAAPSSRSRSAAGRIRAASIGHRQLLTTVRIAEILLGGAKPSKKAAAKAEAKEAKAEVAPRPRPKPRRRKPRPRSEAKAEAAPKAEAKAETAVAAPLFKAPKGEPDDLTVIKGIGPVAAKAI